METKRGLLDVEVYTRGHHIIIVCTVNNENTFRHRFNHRIVVIYL